MAGGQSEWCRSTIIPRPNFHMASALPAAESSTPKLFLVGKDDLPARRLELPDAAALRLVLPKLPIKRQERKRSR
jgi:hypothetical protein